jgi:ABC-type oligopeptide transport system substrate-binding subunit
VNADSFIRAWNYAAYGPNAQNNAYFMSNIAGIDEVSLGPNGEDPESEELSGLVKVDDLTFTVELKSAFAKFAATVGYSGFFPVAEECLADAEACNETPIGNGPYKIEGSWEHDTQITLVRNDDWTGEPGKADKLIYTIFTDTDAGYAAFQAGDLDVMYAIPPAEFRAAQAEYGDALYTRPSNTFTYMGFPLYNANFQDVRIRRAISMAINRQEIIDAVFNGRFFPAQGVVSPNFEGYRPGACEFCEYNPTEAAALLAEAGGWHGGPLELWANAGANHEAWVEAVGHQIETALGIPFVLRISLPFAEYLETAGNHAFTGPFRLGWGPDYPVLETYLGPLYGTNGSSNNGGYSNPEFDALVAEGNAADTSADAIAAYQAAEDIIVNDLPVIPMWFGQVAALYNDETVDTFVYNPISGVSYGEMVLVDRG